MLIAPYVLPGFLFAIFLCAFKAYYQALVFMLAVLYATSLADFSVMVFFTIVSIILGRFRAASE